MQHADMLTDHFEIIEEGKRNNKENACDFKVAETHCAVLAYSGLACCMSEKETALKCLRDYEKSENSSVHQHAIMHRRIGNKCYRVMMRL